MNYYETRFKSDGTKFDKNAIPSFSKKRLTKTALKELETNLSIISLEKYKEKYEQLSRTLYAIEAHLEDIGNL